MNISIRRATLADSEAVAGLFNDYRMFYKQADDIALAIQFITQRICNTESVIFIAQTEEGDYLGFTQLYPTFSSVSAQKSWLLNDLFVAATARKLGIAKQLMNAAKTLASDTKANGIALETSVDNHNAQTLYESLGYVKGSGFDHYFLSTSST